MDYKQNYEIANSGYNGGGAFMWVLLIIVVLFILFKDMVGHKDVGYGYGAGYGCQPKVTYDMPDYLVDRDVISEGCKTREKTDCDGDKTRALIVHESEIAANKEFMKNLTENAELKNKIFYLENKIYTDAQFCELKAEIAKKPNGAPCFVRTSPVELQTCFNDFPTRCGRE